jgi:hypothetical protein
MPDIGTLANLAGIISGVAVIGGAAFAVIKLREYRKQRREDAAVELVRSFYNADFARSVRLIRLLPDGCKAAELRAKGSEHEEAAILVSFAFETIGLLVFRQITPFSIVEELTGGLAVLMWRKLQRWEEDVRVESAQESWSEWFQWLVERLQDHAREKNPKPAHEAFSRWRPTS